MLMHAAAFVAATAAATPDAATTDTAATTFRCCRDVSSLGCSGWCDETSPASARSKIINGQQLTLVFSDEFNTTVPPGGYNTSNTAGKNEKWSATYASDSDAQGQTFLDPHQLQAANGTLIVTGVPGKVAGSRWIGGQLSSWNRVCFQGGYLEVRYKSPGTFGEDGLWPAIWTLGNLARDAYPSAMTSGFWPWSFDTCAFPSPAALYGSRQAHSACDAGRAADGLRAKQGRGAMELDLLEYIQCAHQGGPHLAAVGARPNSTCLLQSVQIAPRLPPAYRPFLGEDPTPAHPWYDDAVWRRRAGDGWHALNNRAFYGLDKFDTIGTILPLSEASFDGWHTVGLGVEIGDACGLAPGPLLGYYERTAHARACRNQSKLFYTFDGVVTTEVRLASRARARGLSSAACRLLLLQRSCPTCSARLAAGALRRHGSARRDAAAAPAARAAVRDARAQVLAWLRGRWQHAAQWPLSPCGRPLACGEARTRFFFDLYHRQAWASARPTPPPSRTTSPSTTCASTRTRAPAARRASRATRATTPQRASSSATTSTTASRRTVRASTCRCG